MKKEPIISIKNLVVQFNVRSRILTAIRNVDLDIYPHETLAIVGESGSGKSVLTKTFTGMLESNGRVADGEIWYEGNDLAKYTTNTQWQTIRGRKIATVFQDPMTSLNPIVTIGEQIAEVIIKHQGKSRSEARQEAVDIMTKVGIPDADKRYSEYPFQYSGGMRQRIVIAIALACRPDILVCDEPTTALDVTIQAQIIELIKSLQKELGFTAIYITHDLGVVASIADRVVVLYAGQVVEFGTAEEVFYQPAHPYTWALLSSLPQLSQRGGDLFTIHGTPPSLYHKVVGDAFAPRNPYALEIDYLEEPPMFQISETHAAKTWLLDPRAPKVEPPAAIQMLRSKLREAVVDVQGKGK